MLELLLFLNSSERKIVELIKEANYTIEENTPLCLIGEDYFGFLKKSQKTVVICTNNAKRYGGYNFYKANQSRDSFKTGLMIRRAIRHEAVHIAQECNNGNLLNILDDKNKKISPYKLNALKGSTSISGEYNKEYEAYTLEDRPKKVILALKKYCLANKK